LPPVGIADVAFTTVRRSGVLRIRCDGGPHPCSASSWPGFTAALYQGLDEWITDRRPIGPATTGMDVPKRQADEQG